MLIREPFFGQGDGARKPVAAAPRQEKVKKPGGGGREGGIPAGGCIDVLSLLVIMEGTLHHVRMGVEAGGVAVADADGQVTGHEGGDDGLIGGFRQDADGNARVQQVSVKVMAEAGVGPALTDYGFPRQVRGRDFPPFPPAGGLWEAGRSREQRKAFFPGIG